LRREKKETLATILFFEPSRLAFRGAVHAARGARAPSTRCFKHSWKEGKVDKVGKEGKEGKVGIGKVRKAGCESCGCQLSTRFYSILTKMVKKINEQFCRGNLEKV
jgi:hypothetical protein